MCIVRETLTNHRLIQSESMANAQSWELQAAHLASAMVFNEALERHVETCAECLEKRRK